MTQSKYLTGDKAAIEEFLDRFDVRPYSLKAIIKALTWLQVFLFDCDGETPFN